MLAKIKGVKLLTEYKNPNYKVKLECPDGGELIIRFDYTYSREIFMPLKVYYNGVYKGAKLAWYTDEVEKVTVQSFLEQIAIKINKKYNFDLKEHEFKVDKP
ncbi:hypothetical protein JCM9140_2534 [Halalkalibacter wakoensis JCM 9140]|uniref:Uncharacterized protein n=1 Tax=Halalkalibacter wakoensis JCM 9140 TaxID=1236970 RepID=W4Q3F6_9BACI|nr:hypothetical protein [Halalkalibacter wakoensis]GAE26465.1 hypothetical protein JCM9140_2534 [Halalkalibacter wakoensis JCM 9140]